MLVNQRANKEMKQWCINNGVTRCMRCGGDYILSYHHRHKRRFYYNLPVSALWDSNQFILVDQKCHDELEYNKQLTQDTFLRLRGKDKYEAA